MTQVKNDIRLLPQLIQDFINEQVSTQQVETFAAICIDLATSYLITLKQMAGRLYDIGDVKGLAADGVADLFRQPRSGYFPYIVRYFNSHRQQLVHDEDWLYTLKGLIAGCMTQRLKILYRHNDPAGAKIYRRIRQITKENAEICLQKRRVGQFLVYTASTDSQPIKCPLFPHIEQVFYSIFRPAMSIDQLVLALFQELGAMHNGPVAVSLADLVFLVQYARDRAAKMVSYAHDDPSFHLKMQESVRSMERILGQLREKLINQYVHKGKLRFCEALAIYAALQDIAAAFLEGDKSFDNYTMLLRYWPELTKEQYMSSTRMIFEYFVRQLKDGLSDELKLIF
jgi:hypothetical protein